MDLYVTQCIYCDKSISWRGLKFENINGNFTHGTVAFCLQPEHDKRKLFHIRYSQMSRPAESPLQ